MRNWSTRTSAAVRILSLARMVSPGVARSLPFGALSKQQPSLANKVLGPMDDVAQTQDEVLGFLADPATYGAGTKVRRIDTHAASVFLAGDRALKIKRAVRFPFLDYSTLAKRKAMVEAEIAVNRPLAPELYRGVIAITRERDGRLTIGGNG